MRLYLSGRSRPLDICELDVGGCDLPTACCGSLTVPGASNPFPGHVPILGPDPYDQFFPLPKGVFVRKVVFVIAPTYGGQAAGPSHKYTVTFKKPSPTAWSWYSCDSQDDGCEPPPAKTCTARCCGGEVHELAPATDVAECEVNGHAWCATKNTTLHHARFGGDAQQWHPCATECCAKCGNREAYHQVVQPDDDWVFVHCTEYANAWCEAGDRGGLDDAAWLPPRNDGTDRCVSPVTVTTTTSTTTTTLPLGEWSCCLFRGFPTPDTCGFELFSATFGVDFCTQLGGQGTPGRCAVPLCGPIAGCCYYGGGERHTQFGDDEASAANFCSLFGGATFSNGRCP
jgi:hypothetical protein